MSEARLKFLDWRPDLEDTENPGLTVAQNVIHEPEGWKSAHLASSGSFSTTGGMASVTSVIAIPIGSGSDLFCAWVSQNGNIDVGINGNTATTASTGYPLSHATVSSGGSFISFASVAEYAENVYFTVESWNTAAVPSSTTTSQSFSGYIVRP